MLYMRCSEGHWRPVGIMTCGANLSLQKTKIWRNWSLVMIISWTYNAENFAIPLQNAKHLHREQKHFVCSFFQDWEASPALVSAAKEGTYTCQREFVWIEVKRAESSKFILFTTEIKGFLYPAYLDLNWRDMTNQFDIHIWTCIYFCVCLRNAN
jgi:hypothetical protein